MDRPPDVEPAAPPSPSATTAAGGEPTPATAAAATGDRGPVPPGARAPRDDGAIAGSSVLQIGVAIDRLRRIVVWLVAPHLVGLLGLAVAFMGFRQDRRALLTAAAARQEELAEQAREILNDAWVLLGTADPQGPLTLGDCAPQRIAQVYERIAEAQRKDPSALDIHRVRGGALLICGDTQRAEAEFRAVLGRDPSDADAHHNLGIVLSERGEHREAEAHVRRAVELRSLPRPGPGSRGLDRTALADTQASLGEILLSQGRTAEAIRTLRHAREVDPQLALPHYYLAVALTESGSADREEILRELRFAIRHFPPQSKDVADAHYSVGIVLLDDADREMVRLDAALRSLAEALRVDPRHREAARSLGKALLRAGRCDEAVDRLVYALELSPEPSEAADVYAHLGVALLELGREAEALEQCRHRQEANPASACAIEDLRRWRERIAAQRPAGVACGAPAKTPG